MQRLLPRQWDGGKRLVHFIQVDVVQLHAGLLQSQLRGWHGGLQHDDWVMAQNRHVMNARQGLHIQATQPALVDDQHTTRTITHLAGVGRRDQAALLKQFDVLNAFKRRLEANAFIDGMHILGKRTARVAYRHRQYFPLEPARLAGRCRALMALQGKTVQRFLVQAVLARHHFCAYELAEHGFAESTRNGRAMVVAKPRLLRERTGTAHGHAGHGLDTGGDHHIHGPRHDRLRSKMNRLL